MKPRQGWFVRRKILVSHNPYAPPTANVSDVVEPSNATSRVDGLYSARQISVASFIGSPLAAAMIAASNFRKLGQPTQARNLVLWGVIGTIVVMAIAFVLPDRIPQVFFPLAYSLGIRAAAAKSFDSIVKEQKDAGSKMGSWWPVIGNSIFWMLIVLAALVGISIALARFGVNVT
jgi:uncharacterized membrane protein AbrB (regulator of aidB expression)